MNAATAKKEKSAIIEEIAHLMISSAEKNGKPWDELALVADFSEGGRSVMAYQYEGLDVGGWKPDAADIVDELSRLVHVMKEQTGKPWHQALINIRRSDCSFEMQFD